MIQRSLYGCSPRLMKGAKPLSARAQTHFCGTDPPPRSIEQKSLNTTSVSSPSTPLTKPSRCLPDVQAKSQQQRITILPRLANHLLGAQSKATIPTLRDGYALPFEIPTSSALRSIGNTPLVEVEDGIYGKLEGFNVSGTIKDRMISNMILAKFAEGTVRNGDTISLVTSGSAGSALMATQRALAMDCGVDIGVVIMMPKAYASKATRIIADGASVEYDKPSSDSRCQLVLLDGTFADAVAQGKAISYKMGFSQLDQHYDMNGMLGHESTAVEIMTQVPEVTDVVCSTGSGATCGGLRTFLDQNIAVHARPSVSGTIAGLGDITKYNNFCQPHLIVGYKEGFYDPELAREHQEELGNLGVECGPSSGACMWLARQIKQERSNAKIVFIAADGTVDLDVAVQKPQKFTDVVAPESWSLRMPTRQKMSPFPPKARTRQLHQLGKGARGAIEAPVRHRHPELVKKW